MPKVDIENILEAIKAKCQSGLNAKITAIEAEKAAAGDGLTPTLAQVDSTNGYFLQTWSEKILNIDPAIFIEADTPEATDGGTTAELHKVAVYAILVDSGNTNDTVKRIFRYSRALKELFENYDFNGHGKFKIGSILPTSWPKDMDSSEQIKIGGITLTIPLA